MEKTKILLANYPKMNQTATFVPMDGDGEGELEIFTGYDINVDNHEVTLNIARDMIAALLTYDEVLVLGNNITDVIQVWGSDYLKELLRSHLLRAVPDVDLNPVLRKDKEGMWHQDFFGYASGCENLDTNQSFRFDGPFGHVENWLIKKGVSATERNAIIYLLQDNAVQINTAELRPVITEETARDMLSTDFLTDKDFYRVNDGKVECNMLSRLRLHHLNTLSVVAAKLGADGMKTDGAISDLMMKKTRSVFSSSIPDGVDALTCINQQKGFPDLGQLFVDRVIGLDDILKLRNSIQGRQFRYWAKRDEYEEERMRQDVMNSVRTVLGGRAGSALRMLICNLVGIAGFVPGVAASVTDSFVVNEILKGWHPNMFLDNKLKSLIDEKIAKHDRARRRKEAAARFKGVRRNDPCPCGSGKKFKNCCGKGL